MLSTNPKILSKVRRRIRDRNRRFKAMTKPQQRVAIAQDVIVQIKAKKLIPAHCYAFFARDNETGDGPSRKANDADLDLSEVLAQEKCDVCGIGSLFASAVGFNDQLPVSEVVDSSTTSIDIHQETIHEYLKPWFSEPQLQLIETFYEQHVDEKTEKLGLTEPDVCGCCRKAVEWYHPILKLEDDKARMLAIMENIVANNGKFKP